MEHFTLYFDGLCEPKNPGGVATSGWALFDESGKELHSQNAVVAKYKLEATNNYAEYCGLGLALRWLVEHEELANSQMILTIYGDSQLVVNQINKTWAIRNPRLQKLALRCFSYLEELSKRGVKWTIEWVTRDKNHRADELSQIAYERATGKKVPVRFRK